MNSKKSLISSFVVGLLVLPFVVFAAGDQNWIADIMKRVASVVWQLFAGLAVVMFIFAGISFVISNGEPGKITTARQAVIWGVVGIIVATAAFAMVNFVSGLAGV